MLSNNEVKKKIINGSFYSLLTRYSDIVLQLFITAILSRILTPNDFGLVAVVTVFVVFFKLLSDIGIGPAIIQDKRINDIEISSTFLVTIFIASIVSIIFFLFAKPVSILYSNRDYITVVHFLSFSLFFQVSSIVPRALIRKRNQFALLGVLSISSSIIAGSLSIFLAITGYGYKSLLLKSVCTGALQFFLFLIFTRIKIFKILNFDFIKRKLKYSFYQFLFNFVNYFSRNLDKLVIGKFIGEASLGYYEKSYRFMLLPLQTFTHAITPVIHPVLSDIQNEHERIYNIYLKFVKVLALIGFPLTVFLFLNSESIIYVAFGHQWKQSIPVFRILSLSVGIQMILSSTGSIFQSSGRTDMMFISGLISSFFMISGTLIGVLFKSTELVSIFLVIAFFLNFIQCNIFLIKATLKQRLLPFIIVLVKPFFISLIMYIILLIFNNNIEINSSIINISLNTVLTFILYMILIRFFKEYNFVKSLFHSNN